MKLALLTAASVVALSACAFAETKPNTLVQLAFFGSGVTASAALPNCPQGTSYADGCTGAPTAGSYKLTAAQFATYGQVNGLVLNAGLGNHPQPWNVACVDYSCAYDKSAFDPTGYNIASSPLGLKDASIQANWTRDGLANCVPNTTTHIVTCGTVASPLIQYYDFQNTSFGCMRLVFNGNTSGDVVVKNNHFKNADGSTLTTSNCNVSNGALLAMTSNALVASITVTQNEIDGNGANLPDKLPQVVNMTSSNKASFTFTYNTCSHLAARCGSISTGGPKTIDYNAFIGMTYPPNGTYPTASAPNTYGIHGEIFENSTAGIGNAATAIEHEDFNTILTVDENGTSGNRITSAIFLSDGGSTSSLWGLFTANNNTILSPPSDGINPGTITLVNGGTGYVVNDTIYTTAAGCGNLGPELYAAVVNGGTTITTIGSGPFSGASSGNGHCAAVPTNPVGQGNTTGSGSGVTVNFSNWNQQTVGFVIVGESREMQAVQIMNNYIGVTNVGTIVTTSTPGCWSFASGAPSVYTATGNINWKTGAPISSTIITGTNAC